VTITHLARSSMAAAVVGNDAIPLQFSRGQAGICLK